MGRDVGRPVAAVVSDTEERSFPERQARRQRVARSLSNRCRIVPRCADGLANKAVAAELGVHEHTIGKWRRRFPEDRIDGLSDGPRSGRPRTIGDDRVAGVVRRTPGTRPADVPHWSTRSMAGESGLSHTTVGRTRNAFGPQPHRSEIFKPSGDPEFADKVRDIVGLHLSPPDRAPVLCVDGKSRIRVLDRTQPVPPMVPGVPRAAGPRLQAERDDPAVRRAGHRHRLRHRKMLQAPPGQGVPRLPEEIDTRVPKGLDVHIVMDNSATHKTAQKGVPAEPGTHCRMDYVPVGTPVGNQTNCTCSPASSPRNPTREPQTRPPCARGTTARRTAPRRSRGIGTLRRTPIRCTGRIIRPTGKPVLPMDGSDGREEELRHAIKIPNAAA